MGEQSHDVQRRAGQAKVSFSFSIMWQAQNCTCSFENSIWLEISERQAPNLGGVSIFFCRLLGLGRSSIRFPRHSPLAPYRIVLRSTGFAGRRCVPWSRPQRDSGRAGTRCNGGEDVLPNAALAPARETVVDRLMWSILSTAIFPATSNLLYMHDGEREDRRRGHQAVVQRSRCHATSGEANGARSRPQLADGRWRRLASPRGARLTTRSETNWNSSLQSVTGKTPAHHHGSNLPCVQ